MVLDEAIVPPDGSMSKSENAVINLIIAGFIIFLLVKAYNKTKTPQTPKAPAGPLEIDLLKEIRAAIKKQIAIKIYQVKRCCKSKIDFFYPLFF